MIKVLIVEDEEFIRKGLKVTIDWEKMGFYIVSEGINGEDGLNKILEYSPQLVITDIKMPKMNGLEMIKKAKNFGKNFESILLTSHGEFKYAQIGIELGVLGYILKPLDEDILYKVLEKVKEKVEVVGKNYFFSLEEYMNNATDRHVYKALKKIQENYYKKITIQGVSDEIGVSAGYLSRKIKEVLSDTFLEILNKYRVQKAIDLFEHEELKMYKISDKVGFTDYKHFCTVFKKYMKVAPGEFFKKR